MKRCGCTICGIEFGVPEYFVEAREADGANFFCPNGHLVHISGERKPVPSKPPVTREGNVIHMRPRK